MASYEERKRGILSLLFDYEELSEEVLRMVLGDTRHSRRILNSMLEEGVIRQSSMLIKNNGIRYKTSTCYITKKGKQVLSGKEIENNDRTGSNTEHERKKKVSDSIIMCCKAGCIGYRKTGYPEFYNYAQTTGYLNINPFAVNEIENIQGYEVVHNHFDCKRLKPLMDSHGVVFNMKQIRAYYEVTTDDAKHFKFSSATGILLGRYNPYFMYHANEGYLSSSRSGEENFVEQITLHLHRYGVYQMNSIGISREDGIDKAIIFVNNKISFRRLIKNYYGVNYGSFEQFKITHIIPTTMDGVHFLKLQTQNSDFRQIALNILLKIGYKPRGYSMDNYLYPMVDKNGKKVYYGLDMDLRGILHIYKNITENSGVVDFRIFCLDWQRGYYQTIFGSKAVFTAITTEMLINAMNSQ